MCRSTSSDAVIVKLTSVHPQKGQCRRLKKMAGTPRQIALYCLVLPISGLATITSHKISSFGSHSLQCSYPQSGWHYTKHSQNVILNAV